MNEQCKVSIQQVIENAERNNRRWHEAREFCEKRGELDYFLQSTPYEHLRTPKGIEPGDYRTIYRAVKTKGVPNAFEVDFGSFKAQVAAERVADYIDRQIAGNDSLIEYLRAGGPN